MEKQLGSSRTGLSPSLRPTVRACPNKQKKNMLGKFLEAGVDKVKGHRSCGLPVNVMHARNLAGKNSPSPHVHSLKLLHRNKGLCRLTPQRTRILQKWKETLRFVGD